MQDPATNIEQFKEFLKKTKDSILSLEPEAEVWLFGSRARGDFNDESDWDILILLPGEVVWERKEPIIDALTAIQCQYLTVYNIITYSQDLWYNNDIFHETPFYKYVQKERVRL